MAATCSLPLHPTLQSWDTGDTQSFARGNNSSLLSSFGNRSNASGGIDKSRHTHHHQPQSNGTREMNKVSASAALDKSRQNKQSSDLRSPAAFKMTAKHEEPNSILKRSYSTPAVRSMAQESTAAAGEKKRNKLGYHRTSIACSHCRRRKIRCIVSSEIQNRCINCIRLKKDCSFHPVDQQPMMDSRGKPPGQGTSGSAAHSQSSSPALAPGHPGDVVSRSMYGTGPLQDHLGHAPAIVPSSVGYASVTGEGLGMPIPAEQNFSTSPDPNLAWGSAEPSPVTLPGSMDMGYGWRYGSDSGTTEQISPFGPPSTQPAWMAITPVTAQPSEWNWNNGVPPATQARSMSFSGEIIGHPQQPFAPVPSNTPYSRGGPEMGGMFASPLTHSPGTGHLSSQPSGPGGSWQPQQQQVLQQQQPRQQNMDFASWGFPHGSGPSM